jgi:hypothetical protein
MLLFAAQWAVSAAKEYFASATQDPGSSELEGVVITVVGSRRAKPGQLGADEGEALT